MKEITIFMNPAFGEIRTAGTSEEPLFCASDVCKALEYSNSRDAVSRHVSEEDVVKCDTLTKGGNQRMTFVNESGLYSLIFGCKLPKAKEFKHWVTSEVLPSIRKKGSYSTPKSILEEKLMVIDFASKLLKLNDASKLAMLKSVSDPLGLPTPNYVSSKGVLKSATELLNEFNCGISTIAFNKLAIKHGLLEENVRNTSHGLVKTFKTITENGLEYGENQVNPNNPKETQPLWYKDKFQSVLEIFGL